MAVRRGFQGEAEDGPSGADEPHMKEGSSSSADGSCAEDGDAPEDEPQMEKGSGSGADGTSAADGEAPEKDRDSREKAWSDLSKKSPKRAERKADLRDAIVDAAGGVVCPTDAAEVLFQTLDSEE